MLYFSMELKDGKWKKCVMVNALTPKCYIIDKEDGEDEEEGPLQLQPEETLEAVEVYTEVLMAPIEFTSQRESPSQLQTRFYKRKQQLEKIKGPVSSEPDRYKVFTGITEKEIEAFDEKLGVFNSISSFEALVVAL